MMRITAWPLVLVLTLVISGCGTSQPSKLYLLNASGSPSQPQNSNLSVGLGPVKFPAYLDRSKIMVRTGNNSFRAAEYHRWAEPLETNFSRVLAQNLGNNLPGAAINHYPWRNGKGVDVQAVIEVLSFDTDNNNQARLLVRWELLDAGKKSIAMPRLQEYSNKSRGDDYEERVAAMSECVTAFSQELAQQLNTISK